MIKEESSVVNSTSFCQQGWQCPICKRVYSPFTHMCYYCGQVTTSNEISYTGTNKK